MEEFYCKQCKEFADSESCAVHGKEFTILVDQGSAGEQLHAPAQEPADPRPTGENSAPVRVPEQVVSRQKPVPERRATKIPSMPVRIDRPPRPAAPQDEGQILRFRKSERLLHWAIALPFMVCWFTALILVTVYNPDPLRPLRDLFSWVHRLSGVCLIVLPTVVIVRNRDDYRIHLANIKCAWLWSIHDMKWIALMGLAAISKRIVLPEQGKFNAAEKVNFMSVMLACPFFIVTGTLMWLHEFTWMAWLVHGCFALMVSPTMLGHIYMATINPDTKVGLRGMISGYVDREWAKHHYAVWYREHVGKNGPGGGAHREDAHDPDHDVRMNCPSCTRNLSVSRTWVLQRISSVNALLCPNCGSTFAAINAIPDGGQLQWLKDEIGRRGADSDPVA